jgi:hypothetical protein
MLRPNPRENTQIFAALTWGQGEALANVYLGYDSNIVVANASPLQIMRRSLLPIVLNLPSVPQYFSGFSADASNLLNLIPLRFPM